MDYAILQWIRETLWNGVTCAFFPFVSTLGNGGAVWFAIAAVLLCVRSTRRAGALMILALAVTYLVNDVTIKNLVERPRPFADHPELTLLIPPPGGFSFPSGHSASSFAAAGVLFWEKRRPIGVCAIVLAALIAFSRAFLCVHYPSDVLAGSLIGFALGTACVFLARRYLPPKEAGKALMEQNQE